MKKILISGLIAIFIIIGSVGAEQINNYMSPQDNITNTTPTSEINQAQSSDNNTTIKNENNQNGDNMEEASTETSQNEESLIQATTKDGIPISKPSPTAQGSNPDHKKSVNTDGFGLVGS